MTDKDRFFEDDPYWNIDTLTPRKQKNAPSRMKSGAESRDGEKTRVPAKEERARDDGNKSAPRLFAAPYEFAEDAQERKSGFPLHPFSAHPERSYVFPGEGAVRQVDIYAWPNKYAFFAGFRKNALAILHMEGTEAPYVEYFSFMPQYHQLTAAQLRYYLYWRSSFHAGKCLRTDFCYLLLYICEVINLPGELDPAQSVERLCRLWLSYRHAYPKLDKYLSEWICDYCLVNGVRPPDGLFEAIAPFGRQSCVFREFYLTREDLAHPGLLASSYNYKTSKYRTKENAQVFDKHIPAAMDRFMKVYAAKDKRFAPDGTEEAELSRMSYDGAVCVYGEKKRIDVHYTPVRICSPSIFVTDAVKLCENYVHSALGIRARFPTPSPDARMRAAIEEYFVDHLPSPGTRKSAEEFRYDERYEPASRGFSAEEAARIEQSSIPLANALGSVYDEKETPPETPAEDRRTAKPTGVHASALRALRDGGTKGFEAYASGLGVLPHTLFDEINEEALVRVGDVVIVSGDNGFELLCDYKEEVDEWINSSN